MLYVNCIVIRIRLCNESISNIKKGRKLYGSRTTAPSKRKNPYPDSLAANPAAPRTLTRLVATGVIKQGDKPQHWYKHPQHARAFASFHSDKFRKRFGKLLTEKYGTVTRTSMTLVFHF